MIGNPFNACFSTMSDKLIASSASDNNGNLKNNNPLNYLFRTFKHPFPNIKFNYTSTKDTEKIVKSLKAKNSLGCNGIMEKF
jgi:hypothetical protein